MGHKPAILLLGGEEEKHDMYVKAFVECVPDQKYMHNDRHGMVYRLEKVQSYLKAGTPLAHFDHHCIVDRRYLKKELGKDAKISVIFDGTTRLGDVQAIIFRFVVDDGKNPPELVQRLVALPNLESSGTGEGLAGVIGRTMAKYNVPPQNLVFGSRDGCSVNDVCTTTLKGQIF